MKKTILFVLLVVLPAALAVAAPSITLDEPSGGNLCLGRTIQIKWTVTGYSGKIKIVLLKDGTSVGVIDTDLNATPSSYNWTVGDYQGGTVTNSGTGYKIRVRSVGEGPADTSKVLKLNKCIDPNILKRMLDLREVVVKWPPDPDPCPCPEFDLSRIREIMGNPTSIFKLQLLKNGVLLRELGSFGGGKVLPETLKTKLLANDFSLFRQGGARFSLVLVGENGSILNEFALKGAQTQRLR